MERIEASTGNFGVDHVINQLIDGTEPKNILIPFIIQLVLSVLYIGLRFIYVSQIISVNNRSRELHTVKISPVSKAILSFVPLLFTTAIMVIALACESKGMNNAWYIFMVSLTFFWIYQILSVVSDIGWTIELLEGRKPNEYKIIDDIMSILKRLMLKKLNKTLLIS